MTLALSLFEVTDVIEKMAKSSILVESAKTELTLGKTAKLSIYISTRLRSSIHHDRAHSLS